MLPSRKRILLQTVALALVLGGCEVSQEDQLPQEKAGPAKVEQGLGGENLAGTNLGGVNLGATNLAAANLAGVNLGGTNLAATNLAGANLAGSNLAGTNLGGANLAGTNLAGSNLAGVNLAGTNLAGVNLAGTNLAGSNLAGTNLAATNLAGANLAGTNLAGTNLAGANAGINIHALPSANGMLKSGEDVFTRANSCAVMGIGSIAFPRLVAANSTGNMKALVGQLPWTMTANDVTLNAWEAIVWGPTKYCVFVMAVPADGTFAGVAGFIKALYRWSAPPTRSISIGQIGGGQTVVTYTGMMNASSHLLSGAITDKTFVAGETAFISATTNNESVQADFSSWVLGTGGGTIILGNVDTTPMTRYAEGAFAAIDAPDKVVVEYAPAPIMVGTTRSANAELEYVHGMRIGNTGLPLPIAKRCAGAQFLSSTRGYPLPAGKCDSYLAIRWETRDFRPSVGTCPTPVTWRSLLGASAVRPYNDEMRGAHCLWDTKNNRPVSALSETYVFLNELPYR